MMSTHEESNRIAAAMMLGEASDGAVEAPADV
jgi:hypothetical protein